MERTVNIISKHRYSVLFICCVMTVFMNIFNAWQERFTYPNQLLFILLAAFVISVYTFLFRETGKTLSEREIIFLIFAFGFIFRLVYTMSTDFFVRQHDLDVRSPFGHLGYMLRFVNGEGLPEVDMEKSWQYYQPPAWHFLCAVFIKIQQALGIEGEVAIGVYESVIYENLQMISLFCSSAIMLLSHKLFKYFRLSGISMYIACAIVAFHPQFIILSGSINNDVLSIMLSLLSVVLAIKWYREPNFKNIILLALSIGISMAVKLSAGLVSLGIAFIFAVVLFGKAYKNKATLIGQFASFGILCVPLALWWQVRNYIQFDIPLTYVPMLSERHSQYVGFRSIKERLFDIGTIFETGVYPSRMIESQPQFEYYDYNIPITALKTSVFGEYYIGQKSSSMSLIAEVLFWSAAILAVISVIAMVYSVVKAVKNYLLTREVNHITELLLTVICSITLFVSYVKFCLEYAHFCTMDFRYISLTVVFGALYIGLLIKYTSKNNKIFGKILLWAVLILTVTFALSSLALYNSIA